MWCKGSLSVSPLLDHVPTPALFDRNLVFCSQDGHSRFVDEALHVLIWLAKQIAFDDDRTIMGGLGAAFPDINTADGLLAGVGLSLRAGPTVEPVSRFYLDAE